MTRTLVCVLGTLAFALAVVALAPLILLLVPLWACDWGAWPPRQKPAVRPREAWPWCRSEN